MVFKKRYVRGKFRRFKRRKFTRSKRARRFVKRIVRNMSEAKYATKYNKTNAANNGTTTIDINPTFPQGADKTERIGNRIKYKNLRLHFSAVCVAGGGSTNSVAVIRLLLFQLRLPLNLIPSSGDFFLDPNQWNAPIRHEAVRVLWDKTLSLQVFNAATVPVTTNMPSVYVKKIRRRIKNNVSFASSATNTPTDPKDLYRLLVMTNSTAANDFTVTLDWACKISFIDI